MFLVVNVGYIIASFIAIFITTLIVYKVANNLFGLGLRLKPILLCAVCAMLISLVLPKIIVGFAGLPATLAVLAVFAVVFAYFVAKYEDLPQPDVRTDAESESCDFGDTLAASTYAADGVQLPDNDSFQPTGAIDGNASNNEVAAGATEALTSSQELSSSLETEVAGNNLNKGQLMPEEESLNDVQRYDQISSFDKADDLVQADNNSMFAETPIVLEDNSLKSHYTAEQENMDSNSSGVGSVIEKQEPAILEELEVVENDLSEELSIQEENNSLDDLQPALASAVAPDEGEAADSVLSLENMDLKEEQQSEFASINKRDEGDTQLVAEIVEYEVNERAAEEILDQNDSENVFVDIDWDNTENDNLDLRAENADTVENNFADNVMNTIAEEPEQVAPEVSDLMPDKELAGQAESPVAKAFVQEVDDGSMKYDEVTVNLVQMETEELDDLIDHAFICKETQDYNKAYKVFKKALVLYPNSEAAPFLVVEIGNILKNKGDYDEAIQIFSEGRNLSQTKHDEMMEQEFISTIAYLRITKNILLQNRLGNIPFLEIPTQILNQIDEEFREWRNVGNI
jgi:tetratricopeptide (TPR) repeat protein